MRTLQHLFANNRQWAERLRLETPDFFATLARQQRPEYLWIGCSDSRVPANEITGLLPGEMFVHRNIANVVAHGDLNCLSVIQFAVEALRVKHVIVCGHYGCGGVQAALRGDRVGLVDNWLRYVQDVRGRHRERLAALPDDQARLLRLCELNVLEQAVHVCQTTVALDAWQQGRELAVHAWIYALEDGRLRDLGFCVRAAEELPELHRAALAAADARPAGCPAPLT